MSKRFGRQQKRKARLEIERLERLVDKKEESFERHKSVVESARRIIETVKKVCPNNVFLERAKTGEGHYQYQQFIEVNPYVCDGGEFYEPIDMRMIDLYDLEISIKNTTFEDMVHFDLELSNPYKDRNRACYRISKEGFKHTSTSKIAKELVDHLKKNL